MERNNRRPRRFSVYFIPSEESVDEYVVPVTICDGSFPAMVADLLVFWRNLCMLNGYTSAMITRIDEVR